MYKRKHYHTNIQRRQSAKFATDEKLRYIVLFKTFPAV